MRGIISKHCIHVLQALATCLRDKEVGEYERQQTERREENVRSIANRIQHIWCHEPNYEVAHPRGARGDRHSLGPVAEVEDLGGQDPADRGERVREVDVVDVDECDANPASCFVRDQRGAEAADDPADDDKRDECPDGATHEERAAADFVNEEQGWERGKCVHDAVDAGGQE